MAKVVQLHGQRPGGWAKERWAWIGAVMADGELTPLARLVACSLAQGFANHETAECRPGLAALMKAVAASRATVLRALNDLQLRGWIERRGGNAPGKLAAYVFRNPAEPREQVANLRPEQVSGMTPEQVSPVTPTGLIPEKSPCTPYKDKPHMNHKGLLRAASRNIVPGGARPTPLSQLVQIGTDAEAAWDEWLEARRFPPLAKVGQRIGAGMVQGWDMPWRYPPGPGDETATRVAVRFAEWLRNKA